MKVGTSRKSMSSADDVPPDSTNLSSCAASNPTGLSCTVALLELSTAKVAVC